MFSQGQKFAADGTRELQVLRQPADECFTSFHICHYPRTRVILQKGTSQVQVFKCIWLWLAGSGLLNAEGDHMWGPSADYYLYVK